MNQTNTTKTTFQQWVQAGQIILAGIVGSTGMAIWVSYMDWFTKIFVSQPKTLSDLRVSIAVFGLRVTCVVGIGSILWLVTKLIEFKQNYEELVELKKKKEESK